MNYPDVKLFVGGQWCSAVAGRSIDVSDPASEERIGGVAHAGIADLIRALEAAESGFAVWREISAFERSKLMRRAAELLRSRVDTIAPLMTLEQGKPLAEARTETLAAADTIDWFAEEARRTYGWIVPARTAGVQQSAIKEPVGPVAAFTPWNFPINQIVRKLSAALAAGCSIIVKGPEETPASPAELIRCFVDAGLPAGVVNLVYGDPAEISDYLIRNPVIRKISFTGSTPVGKHLAALAGSQMKRATMELGGHAPAIICDDADLDAAASVLAAAKFRNAGQVCVAPTRFLVQDGVYRPFLEMLVEEARARKVGSGLDPATTMGPLANARRLQAMEDLVGDATRHGAAIATGGRRIGNKGHFFEPTVIADVPLAARVMSEEPFGPLAIVSRFSELEEAIAEANRLPYGLAAYAYTRSTGRTSALASKVESGMLTVNHNGIGLPEVPFGGVKDSGYGTEGGREAVEPYLVTKLVSLA
ncbi:NAD-dependent succinate-semialdehyde dehydrogenase [Bosea sp. NPDC003192]|uniref:NAD-dependent succinate-semialdehyde dehydrogenase n=1 Tax=Bosea sp. NPDC003192 TaxID=3390551 RepID=UPI003D05EAD6